MDHLKELRSILGDNLILDREQKVPFKTDASYYEGNMPLAVAIPDSIDEVAKLLKYCQKNSIPVVARGGGTALTGSSIPSADMIVLSMAKFDRILEVHPEDRYAVVEPGVRIDTLNQHLSRYGFFYPPDPASSIAATVGGSISTNAGGLRASLYGTTKNWILGLEAVLPNGELIRTGGRVLKRTAGYDLTSLLVGAEGTLGIITKAIVKIWPVPESRGRILAYYDSIDSVGKAISTLKGRGITPMIAEFLDRLTMDVLSKTRGISFPENAGYMLIVDIASTRESIDRELKDAEKILREFNPITTEVTTDQAEMERIYEARKGAYSALLSERESNSYRVVIGDIVVPASQLPAAFGKIQEKIKQYGLTVALFGHISDGNIHANIYADTADHEFMSRVEAFQADFARVALDHDGSVSAEHGIGLEKKDLFLTEMKANDTGEALELMRIIRRTFDPNGIMNRGKMFD